VRPAPPLTGLSSQRTMLMRSMTRKPSDGQPDRHPLHGPQPLLTCYRGSAPPVRYRGASDRSSRGYPSSNWASDRDVTLVEPVRYRGGNQIKTLSTLP
jgi:hypothetical protein